MKPVDKIIYNELVSRNPVRLPDVGTLLVEYRSAAMSSSRRMESARNEVVFTGEQCVEVRSVVDIIEALGLSRPQAEESYYRWLEGARSGGSVIIDGVGEIRGNSFVPYTRMEEVMNPGYSKAIEMKPRRRPLVIFGAIMIPLSILGGLLGGYLWYCADNCRTAKSNDIKCPVTEEVVVPQVDSPQIAEEYIAPVEEIVTAPKEDSRNTVSETTYYISAGVFTTKENAEDFRRQYGSWFPGQQFEIIPYASDKWLVSLYSSTSRSSTWNKLDRLSWDHQNYELWVYERRPGM